MSGSLRSGLVGGALFCASFYVKATWGESAMWAAIAGWAVGATYTFVMLRGGDA